MRSGIKSEWESQPEAERHSHRRCQCAPASSRSGSLNAKRGKCSPLSGRCAPASSRSGSLNHFATVDDLIEHLVRSGIKSEWESQLPDDVGHHGDHAVRSGIKSEWESQRDAREMLAAVWPRALRHQVGVGVSTGRGAGPEHRARWCAPASSRSGSLNYRWHWTPAVTRVCAPASSRSGSLNVLRAAGRDAMGGVRSGIKSEWESQPAAAQSIRLRRGCALRHQVGVGVSTASSDCATTLV